jgi:CRP-like cAMP-binding protein
MDDPILTIEERAINSGRWFSSLSPSLRHDILRCAYVKRFKDGAHLRSRRTARGVDCLRQGAVRVSSTSITGKQITLTYVEPGIWFGDVAIFDGDRRTHDAYAHGETTLLCVAKADFKRILASHVEFYEAMLRLQARRIRQLYGLVEDLNTLPCAPAGQAAAAPGAQLWRSQPVGQPGDPHRPASGAGRAGAAAGRLAPAREPGTQGMEREGSIRIEPGGLVVRDRNALLRIAETDL